MIPERINQLLPASLDSERGLLCSLCLDPQNVGALMAERRIGLEHFTNPLHAKMCEKMMARWSEGRPIVMRMVMRDMEDGLGGEMIASEILTHISTAAFVDEYTEAVIEKHHLREIITKTAEINVGAWQLDATPAPLIESISQLSALATPRTATKSFKELLKEKMHRIEFGEPDANILVTGITKLDRESPLKLGDMPLISGERKAGKSMLAISIAGNVIMDNWTVLYFSLEDRTETVIDRLFAGASRVPISGHHKGMNEGEFQRAERAFADLSDKHMLIRDDVQDLAPMCAITRQMKAKHPDLKLVVVDYAQLVRAKVSKGANREQEVATVSRTLRLLGMELKVAIIVLCQLNQDGATRESKALEQDTTAMWKLTKTDPDEQNKRLIVIPFQRNGESNVCFPVTFFGHIARVENCGDEYPII